MKMIRNRKTGLVFPETPILAALVERDKDFEYTEDYVAPAPAQPAEEEEIPVPLDVNQATALQIVKVSSGIKMDAAKLIVERVAKKGPFMSLDDLVEIKGIGKGTVSRNLDNLKV